MSTCTQLDSVRDYALDELPASARAAVERHIAACGECAAELDSLRLTTAALRMLPDREVPRRTAFVSDKVFEPSPAARFFAGFWKPLMVSASVLAAALYIGPRPAFVPAQPQAPSVTQAEINRRIDTAVANAVEQIRRDDAKLLAATVAAKSAESDREHRAVMEAINILQERQNTATLLAAADNGRSGIGQ